MFRRVAAASRALTPSLAGRRNYTDYHHMKFPVWNTVIYSVTAVVIVYWFLLFSWNSVWFESNREYKRNTLRAWERRMGHGYKWADELGPEIKTIFKGLPTRAE